LDRNSSYSAYLWIGHCISPKFVSTLAPNVQNTSAYSNILPECFRIALLDLAGTTERRKFPLLSGKSCIRKRRKNADCCIRRGCWAGASRRPTTSPTRTPSQHHLRRVRSAV